MLVTAKMSESEDSFVVPSMSESEDASENEQYQSASDATAASSTADQSKWTLELHSLD